MERFWSKVDRRGPDECWEWKASRNRHGYGQFGTASPKTGKLTMRGAHRVAYELLVGPIPDGLEIDHLCRNRGCVNPAHMEPVTHAENIRRGLWPRNGVEARMAKGLASHCKRGHPMSPPNLYVHKGNRQCLTCRLEAMRRHNERRRIGSDMTKIAAGI